MILQVLFYAKLETFVLKCKFNSKSLALPLKISGCATGGILPVILLKIEMTPAKLLFLIDISYRYRFSYFLYLLKKLLYLTCFLEKLSKRKIFALKKSFVTAVKSMTDCYNQSPNHGKLSDCPKLYC